MDDVRNALIVELSAAGQSVRAIARQLGMSKSTVHRVLDARAALASADWDDDPEDDEGGLALLDGEPQPEPTPPFRFVGIGTEWVQLPGDDFATRQDAERFLDANGRSVSALDIWRADYADGSVPHGYLDDATAQIEAAGYRRVPEGSTGRWHWERSDRPSARFA